MVKPVAVANIDKGIKLVGVKMEISRIKSFE